MNINLVMQYIEEYKRNFETVHYQEIYKWNAIKQFQDNFDLDSDDFYSHMETSLSKSVGRIMSDSEPSTKKNENTYLYKYPFNPAKIQQNQIQKKNTMSINTKKLLLILVTS